MTILPPVKKKRDRDGAAKPSGSGDHRQSTGQPAAGAANRRVRPSPRPANANANANEMGSPALKRAAPSQPQPQPQPSSSSQNNSPNNNNSDDEYEAGDVRDEASNTELEKAFAERLATRGLFIKEMVGDGACMFRAIAEQLYGDQEMHSQVRKLCMDYMAENRDYFSDFITEDFDRYVTRKRDDAVHGNHVELQAISEMFARPVEVYQYGDEPINILLPRGSGDEGQVPSSSTNQSQQQDQNQNPPLRLSYHGAVHYNAIVDPQAATIGVGLGLPGMVPGSADRELMTSALQNSEREQIEQTMLQDKIDMTDWQRTQADMEDQVTRESYMSYLRELEGKKEPEAGTESEAKKAEQEEEEAKDIPSTSSGAGPSTSEQQGGSSSSAAGLYEELLAAQASQWDAYSDDVAMAEALLLSQQDYMASQTSGGCGPSSSSSEMKREEEDKK